MPNEIITAAPTELTVCRPAEFSDGVRSRLLVILLLAIIPVVFVLVGLKLCHAHGPVWLNSDPDYSYLMNGLLLANGKRTIGMGEHPGITHIVFLAGSIHLMHAIAGENSLYDDVLLNPEWYLASIHAFWLILVAAILFGLGMFVHKKRLGLIPALLIQCTPFLSKSIMDHTVPYLTIEASMIFASTFMIFALIEACEPTWTRSRPWLLAGWLGLGAGLMMVTKFNAFPVLLFPLLFPRRWFLKLASLLSAACIWLILYCPFHKIVDHFKWIWGMASHKGYYGKGKKGFIDLNEFAHNAYTLVGEEPLLPLICLAGLLVAFVLWKHGRHETATNPSLDKDTEEKPRLWLIMGTVSVAQIIQFFIVVKYPRTRYLEPTMIFMAFQLVIIWCLARSSSFSLPVVWRRYVIPASILLLVVVRSVTVSSTALDSWNQRRTQRERDQAKIESLTPAGAYVFSMYMRSNKSYALILGSEWTNDLLFLFKRLNRVYQPWELAHFDGNFYVACNHLVDVDRMLRAGKRVFIRGSWVQEGMFGGNHEIKILFVGKTNGEKMVPETLGELRFRKNRTRKNVTVHGDD